MRTLLLALGGLVAALLLGIGVLLVGARTADGPLAIIAGGPFTSGTPSSEPAPDWSFAHDIQEVEFQLLNPPRSRTTWIIEHEGRIYIPSGYMTTWWGKIWKQWPLQAEQDGRALLRVDGKLYERELVRIMDGPDIDPVMAELSRKYGQGQPFPRAVFDSGYLWIFQLVPQAQ